MEHSLFHTPAIYITAILCFGIVVITLFHRQLYDIMLYHGFIHSYTERVYDIDPNKGPRMLYVPLGDSLTAGVGVRSYTDAYPYLLTKKLIGQTDGHLLLKPHAIPGATTADAISLLLDKAIQSQPDMMTILLGVNDVHQSVSPETFRNNYDHILKRLTGETHARIYIIGIPYIGADKITTPEERSTLHARTQTFNTILTELAHTYHLPYLDLYTPTLAPAHEEGYYSDDLFHPSAKGYTLWADILYDHLN